jgi:hypothetical protein
MKSLQEMVADAEPGVWKDALDALLEGTAAHERVCADNSDAYNRYYDVPEHARDALVGHLAPAVATIEASAVGLSALRDRLPAARDAAFAEKAAQLGGVPPVEGEPVWIRLMRDLHALREWRSGHLDGVDVHLPPFLLRRLSAGEKPMMFDHAFKAWAAAAGLKREAVRSEVVEVAAAGLLPGVADAPERAGHRLAVDPRVLEARVERLGSDAVLAETRLAAEVLPQASFPVPEEVVSYLEGAGAPRP